MHDTKTKIYFGTGLASLKETSLGFGFEFLNMVLTALVLMRKSGAGGIFHDIATVGYEIPKNQRDRLVKEQDKIIKIIIQNLKLENIYRFKFSHEYHYSEDFKKILKDVAAKVNVFSVLPNFQKYGYYTTLQIAQMKYLYETENARVKLGWTIGACPEHESVNQDVAIRIINQGKLNECFFDSLYKFVFPNDKMKFVYVPAGVDIINGKRYAPYTVTKSQSRPLLTQPIKQYLLCVPNSPYKRKAIRIYAATIIHNWEQLFGEITADTTIDKLQYIQEQVLNTRICGKS